MDQDRLVLDIGYADTIRRKSDHHLRCAAHQQHAAQRYSIDLLELRK
jgi:hypothetical protein